MGNECTQGKSSSQRRRQQEQSHQSARHTSNQRHLQQQHQPGNPLRGQQHNPNQQQFLQQSQIPQPPMQPGNINPMASQLPRPFGAPSPVPIKPQSGVKVMQNDMILRKNSVTIAQQSSDEFRLELEFDALRPVNVSAYFFVKQKQKFFSNLHDSFSEERTKHSQNYIVSAHQQSFVAEFPQNFQTFPEKLFDHNQEFWPIIVVLSKMDPVESKHIYYYFTIEKHGGQYIPHLKKQVLEYNGESYEIQEIYGVENTDLVQGEAIASQQKHANMDDCNKECIICMTDLIDTVIMPCRHMCICLECAKTFQQKKSNRLCPVCRKEIESFLRISKQSDQQQQQQQPMQIPSAVPLHEHSQLPGPGNQKQ